MLKSLTISILIRGSARFRLLKQSVQIAFRFRPLPRIVQGFDSDQMIFHIVGRLPADPIIRFQLLKPFLSHPFLLPGKLDPFGILIFPVQSAEEPLDCD